jgi:hypothetical protein
MASMRSPEMKNRYKEWQVSHGMDIGCQLCERQAIHLFSYWKIVENIFPYDLIAEKHHMLVPLRHVAEGGLVDGELKELRSIKEGIVNEDYDFLLESTDKTKTVPQHFHLHLIQTKNFA